MKKIKKIVFIVAVIAMVIPTVATAGSISISLIKGKSIPEAINILATQIDSIFGRVEEIEQKQILQEKNIEEMEKVINEQKEALQNQQKIAENQQEIIDDLKEEQEDLQGEVELELNNYPSMNSWINDYWDEPDSSIQAGEPGAPKQTPRLQSNEIPEEAVRLNISDAGFSPNEFTVKSGAIVLLSLKSLDKTQVFRFDHQELIGVAIGVAGNENRAIMFRAPSVGDYTFYCDVPGHRDGGEVGVMHVAK